MKIANHAHFGENSTIVLIHDALLVKRSIIIKIWSECAPKLSTTITSDKQKQHFGFLSAQMAYNLTWEFLLYFYRTWRMGDEWARACVCERHFSEKECWANFSMCISHGPSLSFRATATCCLIWCKHLTTYVCKTCLYCSHFYPFQCELALLYRINFQFKWLRCKNKMLCKLASIFRWDGCSQMAITAKGMSGYG